MRYANASRQLEIGNMSYNKYFKNSNYTLNFSKRTIRKLEEVIDIEGLCCCYMSLMRWMVASIVHENVKNHIHTNLCYLAIAHYIKVAKKPIDDQIAILRQHALAKKPAHIANHTPSTTKHKGVVNIQIDMNVTIK